MLGWRQADDRHLRNPILDEGSAHGVLGLPEIDNVAPARREAIQWAVDSCRISIKIALQVLHANVDKHVDAFHPAEALDYRKRQVAEIVGVEERRNVSRRDSAFAQFQQLSPWRSRIPLSRSRQLQQFFALPPNITLYTRPRHVSRKWSATGVCTFEGDQRAAIDLFVRISNARPTSAAIEIDISGAAATGSQKLPTNGTRYVDVSAKPLMLLLRPRADFIERQRVATRHGSALCSCYVLQYLGDLSNGNC